MAASAPRLWAAADGLAPLASMTGGEASGGAGVAGPAASAVGGGGGLQLMLSCVVGVYTGLLD